MWPAAALLAASLLAAPSAGADTKTENQGAGSAGDEVVLTFAGDLAYPVGWGGWQYVEKQKHLLYRQIQPILDSADLNFVNVECPITEQPATADKKYPIRCQPHQIPYFTKAGFNLLSLANNHSIDCGSGGMDDTRVHLKKATTEARPLWWAGTGDSSEQAALPARITVPGKNLVIAFFAVANTSGKGRVGGLHDKGLPARISEAAKHADLVIVSSHHGPEYVHVPWTWTVDRYHELIDAGADLVVGHHAHVVQGVERYKNGFIFYNQGNFSFASRTRRHLKNRARIYSTIGRVTIRRNGDATELARIEIVPLYANNSAKWTLGDLTLEPRHAEPQLLAGEFARFALDEFEEFSKKVPKAQPTSFIRVGDRMFVDLGREDFSPAERKRLIAQQKREYQAVLDAGVQPRPATEAEKNQKTRAGTPWP